MRISDWSSDVCSSDLAYNNLVPRAFNGQHLKLPGASTTIRMRDHQKRVVWRIIASGSTYVAHSVGAGKTFSLCAAVMEQRRLGLVNKPMITVPNHCLAQIDRKSVVEGKRVSVRVDLGGRVTIKKKKKQTTE